MKNLIYVSIVGICLFSKVGLADDFRERVNSDSLVVSRLNLNKMGNVVVARPGEKIFSTVNFSSYEDFIEPDSLYQIVIGYEGVGPQKCIFNELGYRFEGKEGILSFFCEAPEYPGVYEVQCKISSARSSAEALQSWWDVKGLDINEKYSLGKIIVK